MRERGFLDDRQFPEAVFLGYGIVYSFLALLLSGGNQRAITVSKTYALLAVVAWIALSIVVCVNNRRNKKDLA
jgi:hypothetical protein